MNKKRSEKKRKVPIATGLGMLLMFLFLAVVVVNIAVMRNKQVLLGRETQEVRKSIGEYDADSAALQVEIDRQVSRFTIKSELKELNSMMKERPAFVIEKVYSSERPIASTHN